MKKLILISLVFISVKIWAPPVADSKLEKFAEAVIKVLRKGNMQTFSKLLNNVIVGFENGYKREIFTQDNGPMIVSITNGFLYNTKLLQELEKNDKCKSITELMSLGNSPVYEINITGDNSAEIILIFESFNDQKNKVEIKKTLLNLYVHKKNQWKISGWRFTQDISAYDNSNNEKISSTIDISSEAY